MSKFQKEIGEDYKDLKWKKGKLKNDCNNKNFKLHNTQEFLKKYFTPRYLDSGIIEPKYQKHMDEMNKIQDKINKIKPKGDKGQKGMMLYHSVGSGKTCAAISIASNFDGSQNNIIGGSYTILWVTRNSLRNVMYQNIFEQICHTAVNKDKLGNTRRKKLAYFNKITKRKWLKPISYKSFSNLFKKKSQLYRELKKINGEDILKRTLVIVDESHNLSSSKPHGLSQLEKPNIIHIQNLIYNSYKKSKEESVRLLLLSATPALNGMIGLINLLNLLNPDEQSRLPTNSDKFVRDFLNKKLDGFNKVGRDKFKETTKKYISFLDRTKDYNMFARKEYKEQIVNMTNPQRDEFNNCDKLKKNKVDCLKKSIVWNDSLRKNKFRFEHKEFSSENIKDIMGSGGTKFKKLIEKINLLDKDDMKKNKKLYKHVIFIDEPKYVKILTSVLKAHNFKFIFTPSTRQRGSNIVNTLKIIDNLKSKNKKNFGILTKGTIYHRNVSTNLVTQVNSIFNKRPDNIQGDKLRFIVIDKNYLEGVSFFDVKYFHILTEPHTEFEMKQLVGRVVRTCGHTGLPFGKKGWIINVLIYNSFYNKQNYDKLIKKAKNDSLSKEDAKKIKIQNLIIKEVEDNAFDKILTAAIHT